jgi:hypothetical protein
LKPRLYDFRYNVYSQFGEDGVINKIFECIGLTSKICIEFGAWDGFYLSNTASLWTDSWQGILIESDKEKYGQLVENVQPYNCLCINEYVEPEGPGSLETILQRHGIEPEGVDLLSIDVDGNDYYILKSLARLKPRVIICEYNPTIPANMDIFAEKNNYFGASAAAIIRAGEKKGYKMVALTDVNVFFVLQELFHLFDGYETELAKIRLDSSLLYLVTSYAGEFYIVGQNHPPYGLKKVYDRELKGDYFDVLRCTKVSL